MKTKIKKILEGLRCETCSEESVFGRPPNSEPDNLYVYTDYGGATRCFCKKHMSYGREGSEAFFNYDDKWDYPYWGAKLISDILKNYESEDGQ